MSNGDNGGTDASLGLLSHSSFWTPEWISGASAWYQHAPFAFWITEVHRPRCLVELGTHWGFSYMAFCQSVQRNRIDANCHAVDTWKGDEHTGEYGEEVFAAVNDHNQKHYSGFSSLIRSTFDQALDYFPDGSIDLLHIDGLHTYEAVKHDFENWLPKMSDRGIVLFHDTNVRERAFGVWNLWRELTDTYPHFEFYHGHGLGVMGVGNELPSALQNLFAVEKNSTAAGNIRSAYARLGGAVVQDARVAGEVCRLQQQLTESSETLRQQTAQSGERIGQLESELDQQAAQARGRIKRFEDELHAKHREAEHVQARLGRLEEQRREEIRQFESELSDKNREADGLRERNRRLAKTVESAELWQRSWFKRVLHRWHPSGVSEKKHGFFRRLERSIRKRRKWLVQQLSMSHRNNIPSDVDHLPASPLPHGLSPGSEKKRVVYISGEPDTPGHVYRVQMYADALARRGYSVQILRFEEVRKNLPLIETCHALVAWRTPWGDVLGEAAAAAKRNGGKFIFDVDDYMFDPALAKTSIIDGIRTQGCEEAQIRELYARLQQTMLAADFCACTTKVLATEMRKFQKPVFVLPNGYDEETYARSRRAVAKRRAAHADGLLRLGYAGGTRTHQKDFACAASAVARILRGNPECRLVLFHRALPADDPTGASGQGCLDVSEFPDLAGLESQIEWRPMVPLRQLPDELARFDINLSPLEAGNIYCEAKSELKFYEAALVGVPTIASPTAPFAEAIRHGENGFLARSSDEWHACLCQLVSQPELRIRAGKEAFFDVLWKYGPERRAEAAGNMMEQVIAGGGTAAHLFELELHRAKIPRRPPPKIPEYDVIVEFGDRTQSEVDVVVPLHNYSHYVEEALESVKGQTLARKGLIVIEDRSTDNSLDVAKAWIERNKDAFVHIALLRNKQNSGLALSRNAGFGFADARFIMPLDADNTLLPECLERCLKAINESHAAVAFPTIERFGGGNGRIGYFDWQPARFAAGNYIDAMSLIRRAAWAAAGGYEQIEVPGWEDYDLWCKFVHMGLWGIQVPEVLARYRVHGNSMLQTITHQPENRGILLEKLCAAHSWIDEKSLISLIRQSSSPVPEPSHNGSHSSAPRSFLGDVVEPVKVAAERTEFHTESLTSPRPRGQQRLQEMLPLLRCPETGKKLRLVSERSIVNENGSRQWPVHEWRPVFFGDDSEVRIFDNSHYSNAIPERALSLIGNLNGPVLNISAGGTHFWNPNVIELETAIFRNTDIVGDAHALPFNDEIFEAVLALNAFEHYREPQRVAEEILRVLKPGGKVFIHTAFLQPLHEPPWHFYNCTKYGLLQWFKKFDVLDICVSANFNPAFSISWQSHELLDVIESELGTASAERFRSITLNDLAQFWRHPEYRNASTWEELRQLSQAAQERLAAGFEFIGKKREG